MPHSELILYIVKLILGGMAAFSAILLWNRTGESSWMCIIAGMVISYAGTVLSKWEFFPLMFSDLEVCL